MSTTFLRGLILDMDTAWSSLEPTVPGALRVHRGREEAEQRICDGILISNRSDPDPPAMDVPGPPSCLDSGDNGSEKELVHL